MTLIQEAYSLLQNQTDSNLRVIIDMLRSMRGFSKSGDDTVVTEIEEPLHPPRLGALKGKINLPTDLYDHFDDDREEIWGNFDEATI